MGRLIRSCLQSLLKLVNSIIAMVGIAMILYSLWMFRVWYKHIDGDDFQPPWFIYTFLGLGIFLCVITCSGHIAAETVNGHCLSCYMVFVFLLFLLEAAVTADVFLNKHWEEVGNYVEPLIQKSGYSSKWIAHIPYLDFPEDPTGRFDELKNFVGSNFEMCKWTGSLIVAAQALSIFLAMVLRALGPDRGSYYYDSDDDYTPARLPLLKNHIEQQSPYVADPHFSIKNDAWNKNRQ